MKVKNAIELAVSNQDGHQARLAADALRFKRGFDYHQIFALFKIAATQAGIDYTLGDHDHLMELADKDYSI